MNIHSYVANRNSALGRSNPYMSNVRSFTATPGGRGANRSLKPNSLRELQPVPTQDVTIEKHTVFYKLLNDVKSMPLHVAIEKAFADLLRCRAIVWTYNKAQQTLSAPSVSRTLKMGIGVLGEVFRTKRLMNVLQPRLNKAYHHLCDFPDLASMYVPIFTNEDMSDVLCIVQLVRESDALPFSDVDEENARFLVNKFHQVSHLLVQNMVISSTIVAPLKDKQATADVIQHLSDRVCQNFKCKEVEYWSFEMMTKELQRYTTCGGWVSHAVGSVGAVETALRNGTTLNVPDVSKCTGYDPEFDGPVGTQLLVVPVRMGKQMFGMALRGKAGGRAFSNVDATHMEAIAPAIARAIAGQGENEVEALGTAGFSLRLKALLEVAENLSGMLDIDVLIPTIMEKACALLNTERCSLFLVDQNRKFLTSRFHGGLDKSIQIPITRGIVGHTATTGEVVNISDAYSDPRFDKTVDLETGFKTKTLLSVPIYNNRGEIAGVTEMINRMDGGTFDDDDIKMMKAFNVFCGISLDNAKLYTTSLNLTRQLRGFAEMGSSLNTAKKVSDQLNDIMSNAKALINASRATIFLRDVDTNTLEEYLNIGEPVEHGTVFAIDVCKLQKPKIFTRDDIAERVHKDGVDVKEPAKKRSRITSALRKTDSSVFAQQGNDDPPEFHPLCDFPLVTSDSRVLGVLELKCEWKVTPEDVKLLDCFAVFAAISLEKSALKQIAKVGEIAVNMQKWIAEEEKDKFKVPEKLRIPEEKAQCIFTVNFDAPQWDGIGLFKVLWYIMDSYNLFEEFKIPNEMFFRFVSEISSTYNKVPYHNWRHACDVTQFVTYETRLAKMHTVLTKFELLALTISAICHDANHDGFTNVFNEKAETPLGILFKNQSVMETHHCTVSIRILSKEECNLFHTLSSSEFKQMWTLIIQLILITDMAKHFDFLKNLNAELDKENFDLEDPKNRLMLMQVLLKCGDISNVSRPFELADKWCDVLCEEFFRQGDLEMASGMEYTSPLNDREHLDKPKSQIGFYTFVCLPLFKVAARAMPALQANVDQVESNLAKWKAASAAKEAEKNC